MLSKKELEEGKKEAKRMAETSEGFSTAGKTQY